MTFNIKFTHHEFSYDTVNLFYFKFQMQVETFNTDGYFHKIFPLVFSVFRAFHCPTKRDGRAAKLWNSS